MSITKKQLLKLFELVHTHQLQSQVALDIALGKAQFPVEKPVFIKPVVVDTRPKTIAADSVTLTEYQIVVDYSMSFEDMVAAGKYDWVDPDITAEHFQVSGAGRTYGDTILVYFDQSMSGDAVLAELDHRGYRAANFAELCAFGATYSKEQKKFPIIALGSFWADSRDYRRVVYLDADENNRGMFFDGLIRIWPAGFRFLAVRKTSNNI